MYALASNSRSGETGVWVDANCRFESFEWLAAPRPKGLHQRGDEHVRVQHDSRLVQSGRLAHSTASRTSSSEMPSSASFWRTASNRLAWTGVRTIRPPSSLTLKQSTPGNEASSSSGSVSWFAPVTLASTGWSSSGCNLACTLRLFAGRRLSRVPVDGAGALRKSQHLANILR